MYLFKRWQATPLWLKIIAGMVCGILLGISIGPKATLLQPLGDIFLNLIKMMLVPIVFVSLTCGVMSIADPKKMGRIGVKTLIGYCVMMALAATFGIVFGLIFNPGAQHSANGINSIAQVGHAISQAPMTLSEFVKELVPDNAFYAFSSGKILQVILFAILFGISLNAVGEKARPVKRFFEGMQEGLFKLVGIVMAFAPYGVFALMTVISGTYGLDVLLSLIKLILLIYLVYFSYTILVYCVAIKFIARLPLIPFFKGMVDLFLVAFSTSSSSASLPINLRCVQDNLGVSKRLSSFVLPLGSTLNMNGLAARVGLTVVFAANFFGITPTLPQLITAVLLCVLAAVGAAGLPGTSLMVLSMVLNGSGIITDPLQIGIIIALIAGADRIIDMGSTTMNVTGDAIVSLLVAKSENEIDETIYRGDNQFGDTEEPMFDSNFEEAEKLINTLPKD